MFSVTFLFMWNYFEFGPVIQEETLFKDIFYLEFWQPFFHHGGTIYAIFAEGFMSYISVKTELWERGESMWCL